MSEVRARKPAPRGVGSRQLAHLVNEGKRRREDSRERLLAAAVKTYSEQGYVATTIEDIIAEAGLSRVTFYRHFGSKAALVAELYQRFGKTGRPLLLVINDRDWRDPAVVEQWISELFAANRANRLMHRVFAEAAAIEPAVSAFAHGRLASVIEEFGKGIPAFALDPDKPADRERWLEAWLLLFELADQSNHAASDAGVANDPLVIRILARRFLQFVNSPG